MRVAMIKSCLISLALGCNFSASQEVPPILDPSAHSSWLETSSDNLSRKGLISVPFTNTSGAEDVVELFKLDLVGDAQQRGFSQGELMAQELYDLVYVALPKWYISMLASLDLEDHFPQWLVDILYAKTPEAFNRALAAVWDKEEEFVPPRLTTEMAAIAQGICAGLAVKSPDLPCDVDTMTLMVKNVNMLPELIAMTCTMFGAWGKASATGNLLQLRALDFGSSPLANFSTLAVHRPADPDAPVVPVPGQWVTPGGQGNDNGDLPQAFASLTFPGLVGVVTGVSQRGIGLSEKVWLQSNGTVTDLQMGHYDGEADVLVMRDVLELAPNRSSAEEYMRNDVNRTWSVFLGVGDYETQKMDIVGYREADFHAYTPETMPDVTQQPYMEDLVYVDKHPQPSTDSDGGLPSLLASFYGNLSMANTAAVNAGHETGDLHIAVFDYAGEGFVGDAADRGGAAARAPAAAAYGSGSKMWVSVGRIDHDGNYGSDGHMWKACYRPYLEFALADLWTGSW